MEGRVRLVCAECGREAQLAGEIPEEYTRNFAALVSSEGWVPRPGVDLALICGRCARAYTGHETRDDMEKVRGRKDPKAL